MSRRRPSRSRQSNFGLVVHLIEPGGSGGVFQHSVALAEALGQCNVSVVVHTASDAEMLAEGVEFCGCVNWHRSLPRGPRRSVTIAADYALRTVPHLRVATRNANVVHVQGLFRQPLTGLTMLATRRRRAALAFTPHNTFSREGRPLDEWLLRKCARLADVVFVFSEADRRKVQTWGATASKTDLIQLVGTPDPDQVTQWRSQWLAGQSPDTKVVLLAGQLRPDKGGDLLIRSLAHSGDEYIAAIVGEDKGAAHAWQHLARSLGAQVSWSVGYQPMESFVAAIAAADVVAAPSSIGSQSGVLSIASILGKKTVATDVGGLGELATIAVRHGDPNLLALGIREALHMGREPETRSRYGSRAGADHVHTYQRTLEERTSARRQSPTVAEGPIELDGITDSPRSHPPRAQPFRIGVVVNSQIDGGGEGYLRNLYMGLEGQQVECVLFGAIPRWEQTGLQSKGTGSPRKWSRRSWLRSLWWTPGYYLRARATIQAEHRKRPFDLFHLQYKREQLLLSRTLSRLAPVVWTEHGRFYKGAGSRILRLGYRVASRKVVTIVCVSRVVANDVENVCRRSFPGIIVIDNGIDLERYRPATHEEWFAARERYGLSPAALVFASVGRLHPDKRVELALRLTLAVPGSQLLIAGDGPDRHRLEGLAGEQAQFIGHVADPTSVYAAADAFIFAGNGKGEGDPLVLREAAACGLGLVVISPDFRDAGTNAGLEALATEAGALVAAPSEVEGLAAKIAASWDPRSSGTNARTWAKGFSKAQWLERHYAVFADARRKRPRAGHVLRPTHRAAIRSTTGQTSDGISPRAM